MADPRIDQARRDQNLEKAKRREAESERDRFKQERDELLLGSAGALDQASQARADLTQLLEGIEAVATEHGLDPGCPCSTCQLLELADRIKSKGTDSPCKPDAPSVPDQSSDQVDGVAPETCLFCQRRRATQADWDRNGELSDEEAAVAGLDDLCWEAEDESCLALLAESDRPTTLGAALERLAQGNEDEKLRELLQWAKGEAADQRRHPASTNAFLVVVAEIRNRFSLSSEASS